MNQKIKNIYLAFDGKIVGRTQTKEYICETLLLMPREIVDFVTKNCWFISSMKDAYAFAFTGNDLKDQHLVFLSDELLMQDIDQIHYSIAHEIGHVILGHRNSVLVLQSKEEVRQQEREADEFAKQFV